MLRPATPLTVLLFAAFVLLLISVISTPIVKGIPLAQYAGVDFGVFGYCQGSSCSKIGVGYDPTSLFTDTQNQTFDLPSNTRSTLFHILIIHPIAAFFTLIMLGLAISAHFHSPSHSPRYLLGVFIMSIVTLLLSLLAFLVDVLLFVPHMAWGSYIVLAATILIFASGIIACAMRRTLVSRKARKRRIAENAEMNGENFYNRQNAEVLPPMTFSTAPLVVNGAPAADKLPSFATFEDAKKDDSQRTSDERIPLTARTPSERSPEAGPTQPNGGPSGSGDRRSGAPQIGEAGLSNGRPTPAPRRDQYGNIIPQARIPREPRDRNVYSPQGNRGRGGAPAGYAGRGGPSHYPTGRGYGGPGALRAGYGAPGRGGFDNGNIGPGRGGFDNGNGGPGRGGFDNGNVGPGRGGFDNGNVGPGRGGFDNGNVGPGRGGFDNGSGGPGRAPGFDNGNGGPGRGPGFDNGTMGAMAAGAAGGMAAGAMMKGGRGPPPGYSNGYGAPPPVRGYSQDASPISAYGPYSQRQQTPPIGTSGYPSSQVTTAGNSYTPFNPEDSRRESLPRAESPPPLPGFEHAGLVGQAIEMDATTGSPSIAPRQFVSQYSHIRDSDSDVAGMVGLQQQRAELGRQTTVSSETSRYSADEYVPPRQAWNAQTSPLNPTLVTNLPPPGSPTTSANGIRTSPSDHYYEDVPPEFAEAPITNPPPTLTQEPNTHLHPSNSNPRLLTLTTPNRSYDDLRQPPGSRSPAESDRSNFTSVSQRGVNPRWPGNGPPPGGPNVQQPVNRRPVQNGAAQRNDMLLASNPDFELPGAGPRQMRKMGPGPVGGPGGPGPRNFSPTTVGSNVGMVPRSPYDNN